MADVGMELTTTNTTTPNTRNTTMKLTPAQLTVTVERTPGGVPEDPTLWHASIGRASEDDDMSMRGPIPIDLELEDDDPDDGDIVDVAWRTLLLADAVSPIGVRPDPIAVERDAQADCWHVCWQW